jgi:hypothetical protein
MSDQSKDKDEERPDEKATVTLPGTVEKIIPPITPNRPEKVQISVEGAEDLGHSDLANDRSAEVHFAAFSCGPLKHADLVAQSQVLELKGSTRTEDRRQRC